MEIITRKLLIKRVILIVVILLWMYLVFYLSNQNSSETEQTSSYLVSIVVKFYTKFTNNISITNIDIITFIIRKIAHFTLYFIGSFPVFLLLKTYNINKIKIYVFTVLFCTIYACSDEIHQLLIQGRNGNIIDIIIDTSGCVFGMIFIQIVSNLIYKSRIRRNINECS